MSIFRFCFFWLVAYLLVNRLTPIRISMYSKYFHGHLPWFFFCFFPGRPAFPFECNTVGMRNWNPIWLKWHFEGEIDFMGGDVCVVEPSPICREIQIYAPLKSRQFRRGDVSRRNVVNLNPHHLVAHNRVIWANNHVSPWVPKMRNERHSSTRREIDR